MIRAIKAACFLLGIFSWIIYLFDEHAIHPVLAGMSVIVSGAFILCALAAAKKNDNSSNLLKDIVVIGFILGCLTILNIGFTFYAEFSHGYRG